MAQPIVRDLIGRVFGRWTVLRLSAQGRKGGQRKWHCLCSCGKGRAVDEGNLLSGKSISCGCSKRRPIEGHLSRFPEYRSWRAMKERCHSPGAENYPYYGGRGIAVCKRWRESFEAFLADVGRMPGGGYSLERIDNG